MSSMLLLTENGSGSKALHVILKIDITLPSAINGIQTRNRRPSFNIS